MVKLLMFTYTMKHANLSYILEQHTCGLLTELGRSVKKHVKTVIFQCILPYLGHITKCHGAGQFSWVPSTA